MAQDCKQRICVDNKFGNLRKNLQDLSAEQQCPLDRAELGRASWSLLHTFAAYYPENPSQNDKKYTRGFLEGFKYMYPCTHCRGHFQRDYDKDPPQLDNQRDLTLWVCRQHNYVNKILGKSQFPCEYEKLMERWKTGCDSDDL